jgi:hypothetical protein
LGLSTEIADHEYPDSHSSAYLALEDDGKIRMSAVDYGPFVEKWFGHDRDYKYWVDVPAAAVGKLAFELLREKFSDQKSPVSTFRTWCEAHEIKHKFVVW